MSRAQMNTNIKDGVLHKCTAPRLLLIKNLSEEKPPAKLVE